MRNRRLLDTNILIIGWKHGLQSKGDRLDECSVEDADGWAGAVTRLYRTEAILTPIEIEFLCGVDSSHHLKLAQSFLKRFTVVDDGLILAEDWSLAKRFAQQVPAKTRRRQLVDCLIAAIAVRLKYDVESFDQGLPRGNPR